MTKLAACIAADHIYLCEKNDHTHNSGVFYQGSRLGCQNASYAYVVYSILQLDNTVEL